MVDVEVVAEPMPRIAPPVPMMPAPAPFPIAPQPVPHDFEEPFSTPTARTGRVKRPLLELDRRDFIMLGSGGLGVLAAVMGGFGLAQLLRRGKSPPPGESEK